MQDSRCELHDVSCGTCYLVIVLGVVLKVLVLPVIALVGVVVLKEVVSCTILCISVPVIILSFLAVDGLQVLKEVVNCAVVLVILCVLV